MPLTSTDSLAMHGTQMWYRCRTAGGQGVGKTRRGWRPSTRMAPRAPPGWIGCWLPAAPGAVQEHTAQGAAARAGERRSQAEHPCGRLVGRYTHHT